ncbi:MULTISPECIES: flagellar basal body-associated protein FliL [unclassified Caulobacter]|uniref:flagellar basal body-associated protein FliL n=1 Tax=unclassified Caulobacter TaxID=2648921 RepID=UPI0006F424F2|nr:MULTISPECIES: flagellar basal body-associated protein FliL [unclassified Caulobacter]KQV58255.1 flagellar basal body protein FliL [Caulobacter sp. Root342]KQV69240.1 flagellar basal body protein FliL [Caulobacter sp. Root343]
MAKKPEKEAPAPEGEEGAEGEAPAKKKPPMLIIAIAGGVLLLAGVGGGAFLLLKPKSEAAAGEHGKEKKKEKKEEKGGHGEKKEGEGAAAAGGPAPVIKEGPDGVVFYTLPDIVVNMQTADGKSTFLKLKLTFELPDEETAEALTPNLPRLQDMFQTFLRELRPEDLNGSQGTFQLRVELLRRVNLVAAPAKVNAVLIEEMLIN